MRKIGITIVCVVLASCEPTAVQGDVSVAGCAIDYVAIKAAEIVDIDAGIALYSRYVVEGLSEDDLTEQEVATFARMEAILNSRSRPVDAQDLMVLENATAKLSDPSVWNRNDDRTCEPQDTTFSLYCALYFGSIDTFGVYQHRRTAIQEVRFAIEDVTQGQEFDHRLMDFNNLPDTSLDDIEAVINMAAERVRDRLELQSNCELPLDGTLAQVETGSTAAELNAFWAEASRTVAEGDFEGYASTYHPDAVLVSGFNQNSYPIAAALDGWKQGFLDTKAGNMVAGVEFRFTERRFDETTAHETGIFHYTITSNEGDSTDVYIHFEALLVKKDGWEMMMEYQKASATEEEWSAAK